MLNLPLIGLWVKLLKVPYYVLFPTIMAFCSIGVYSVNSNVWDLYVVALFGVLGYFLLEAALRAGAAAAGLRARPAAGGKSAPRHDPVARRSSTFVTRPISAVLLLLAVAVPRRRLPAVLSARSAPRSSSRRSDG